MDEHKKELIAEAHRRHPQVRPVSKFEHLHDCFTVDKGKLIFWFNDQENSTRVLSKELVNENN